MADHLIDIVNENDEVIGSELKSKKPELGFISRVSAILVQDSNGKYIISKRGSHKKLDANKCDLSAFGNVDAGEDYKTAARRELKEELGIDCEVKILDKFYQEVDHKGKLYKFFCGVFLAKSDEEPKLNHELVSYQKMSLNEIKQEMQENPDKFCQGFRNDFNRVEKYLEI
jgi:isopentenyl-diphosphate delta-isomerase